MTRYMKIYTIVVQGGCIASDIGSKQIPPKTVKISTAVKKNAIGTLTRISISTTNFLQSNLKNSLIETNFNTHEQSCKSSS